MPSEKVAPAESIPHPPASPPQPGEQLLRGHKIHQIMPCFREYGLFLTCSFWSYLLNYSFAASITFPLQKVSKYTFEAKLSCDPMQQTPNLYEIKAFFIFLKQSAEHLSSQYCPGKSSPCNGSRIYFTQLFENHKGQSPNFSFATFLCSFFTAPEGQCHTQNFSQVVQHPRVSTGSSVCPQMFTGAWVRDPPL